MNDEQLTPQDAYRLATQATYQLLTTEEALAIVTTGQALRAEIARLRAENAELRQRLDDASCVDDVPFAEEGDDEPEGDMVQALRALAGIRPSTADMEVALVKFRADMEEVIERARKWAEESTDEPTE